MSTELIVAPGTSDRMKQVAQSIPPYDLIKAYRDARVSFNSNDIVLAIAEGDVQGFTAMTRAVYIELAFRRWTPEQRKIHPLSKESAHKRMKMPADTPAFWLVIESPDSGAIGYCAIGAVYHNEIAAS
jgi:hypothetical protein